MLATAMLLRDFHLACPHCGTLAWASDTAPLSRREYEWICSKCDRLVYVEDDGS